MSTTTDTYRGWNISVTGAKNLCANFSFDITDPQVEVEYLRHGRSGRRTNFPHKLLSAATITPDN